MDSITVGIWAWVLAAAIFFMPDELWAKLGKKCKSWIRRLPLVGSKML